MKYGTTEVSFDVAREAVRVTLAGIAVFVGKAADR